MKLMNIFRLILIVWILLSGIFLTINAINNPSYENYCNEGDDIIDDDLCLRIDGSLYNAYSEQTNYHLINIICIDFIMLLFIIILLVIVMSDFKEVCKGEKENDLIWW